MSLQIPAGENSGAGLHAVLIELARQALSDAERIDSDPERLTHAIRTGMKKIRALLRLAKRDIGGRRFRELSRSIAEIKNALSGTRDQVVVAAIAEEILGNSVDSDGARPGLPASALAEAAKILEQRTRDLNLDDLGAGALCKRWRQTRRRVRRAGKRARKSATAEDFHRWRKRVKSLWYQSEALEALSDEASVLVKPAERLSGILGREHDLTMAMEALHDLSKSDRRKLGKRRKKCRRKAFAAAKEL